MPSQISFQIQVAMYLTGLSNEVSFVSQLPLVPDIFEIRHIFRGGSGGMYIFFFTVMSSVRRRVRVRIQFSKERH